MFNNKSHLAMLILINAKKNKYSKYTPLNKIKDCFLAERWNEGLKSLFILIENKRLEVKTIDDEVCVKIIGKRCFKTYYIESISVENNSKLFHKYPFVDSEDFFA